MAKEPETVTVSGYSVDKTLLVAMDKELRGYQTNLGKVKRWKLELATLPLQSAPPPNGMPKAHTNGDPTGMIGSELTDKARAIRDMEVWLQAAESVYQRLPRLQREVCGYLYFTPVNECDYSVKEFCDLHNMSDSTLYRARDKALLEFLLVLKDYQPQGCSEDAGN